MGHAIKKGNKLGHKDIKLTSHSKMRAEERLGITSVEEVRKLAISARYKGISIKSLNKENHKELGIDINTFRKLKSEFSYHTNSDKLYFYKNCVFVFGGNKALTLKTIVNFTYSKPTTKEKVS